MKFSFRWFLAASLVLSPLRIFAANWWEEMAYGPFLSASFDDTNGQSTLDRAERIATNKGIAVKLGTDGDAGIIFDTELLRATGAWTGGWLKLAGAVFDDTHGPNPSAPEHARIYFGTHANTPGWSKGDDFTDPRPLPNGPRQADVKPGEPFFADVPFGPLPRRWAKYRGLHLSGNRVVFAYTVGAASLLESDDLETVDGRPLITRTFNVATPGAASSLLVADAPEGVTPALEGGKAIFSNDAKNADDRTVVGVIGAPRGARLVTNGTRIALQLPPFAAGQKFKVVFAHGTAANVEKLGNAINAVAPPGDLHEFTHGGPPHWKETVKAKGTLGTADGSFPYVVDNLAAPLDNPYKSRIRIGGLDFFKDGRIAFSTWNGDVWIGKGIDAKLENIEWKRYATGLFDALGLKIVDGQVYVLGRDQITRLHDFNDDGEADFYECFNNDVQVTPAFHEYTFGLETDSKGNFYFIKGGPTNPGGLGWGPLCDHAGCMFKVSGSGQKFEVFATGVRAPNGIGVSPDDEITTGDNQGGWVPVDYIHYVKEGDFIEVPDFAHRVPTPTTYSPHLCWVPYDWDNSNGAQVWVTSDKWGPLKGSMLYLSYGQSALFGVLQESVGDVRQGGVFKFPLKFDTGICRARFSPTDGQLYVAGLKGWQTNAAKDGAIHRVRYTGQPVTVQNELHITDKGITIGFTNALDLSSAGQAGNYSIEQYNYHWTSIYGSAEYKVSDPEQKGHDKLDIKSVTVAPDRKSVFLEVPGLQPVMQMKIKMNLKAADGTAIPDGVGNTINVVPPDTQRGANFTSLR